MNKYAVIAGAIYVAIGIPYGVYLYMNGPNQERSLAYNIGAGMTWPFAPFMADPDIEGSSVEACNATIVEMAMAYPQNKMDISQAIGVIGVIGLIETRPGLSKQDIGNPSELVALMASGRTPESGNKVIMEYVCDRIDGFDLSDLKEEGLEAADELDELYADLPDMPQASVSESDKEKELMEMFSDKKETNSTEVDAAAETHPEPSPVSSENAEPTAQVQVTGEECLDQKIAFFRQEKGLVEVVRFDVMNEWRGECGLPPEE